MTEVILLDGGMGQELIKRSGRPASPLWSTQVLIDNPGLVGEVHRAYADAGATVATTNSYAIHRDRLRGAASNHYASKDVELKNREAEFESLLEAAADEAQVVRDRSRGAGAIGPLAASYRPDLHPSEADAIPLYAEAVQVLAPKSDILLFETIASLEALRACLAAGRKADRTLWVALTVDDEDGSKLRSGEAVAEAAKIACEADAVLANCSAPEAMPAALDALASAGIPTGAYGNAFAGLTKAFVEGGATAEALNARRDMGPEPYATLAMSWLDHGATILGGCCETGPAHIAEIAKRLKSAGHTIV